jgi:hypothetical protein
MRKGRNAVGTQAYEIIRRADGRFVIADSTTGNVMDDAQGYGYTAKQKAEKAAWYKFKGGKGKQDAAKKAATIFWHNHKDFAKAVDDFMETWFKEIATGEVLVDEEVAVLADGMGVEGFEPKFLDFLP